MKHCDPLEPTLANIHDMIRDLLNDAVTKNTGADGYPIDWRKNSIYEACADYINGLEP